MLVKLHLWLYSCEVDPTDAIVSDALDMVSLKPTATANDIVMMFSVLSGTRMCDESNLQHAELRSIHTALVQKLADKAVCGLSRMGRYYD